jgi:hypothetical protein
MSDRKLFDLVNSRQHAAAQKFLDGCDDDEAKEQLAKKVGYWGDDVNALMIAGMWSDTLDQLIRSMIRRGSHNYVNEQSSSIKRTAAMYAAHVWGDAPLLELLLTLGADPKGCRLGHWPYQRRKEEFLTILDRFEQRTTLACCLRHYDELHVSSPLILHPDIAALSPFAKILHDIHGINGDMHSFSRTILSYI